jgi:hypothetical protein
MDWSATLDFLKFFLPLAGAAFAWFWNERSRRISDEYERKEQKYAVLIECLQGFYSHVSGGQRGRELKAQFLSELNKCWLYCPDEVIGKAYAFLEKVHTDGQYPDEMKERAVGELILAIRIDLLSRKPVRKTKLSPSDFKHLRVN